MTLIVAAILVAFTAALVGAPAGFVTAVCILALLGWAWVTR